MDLSRIKVTRIGLLLSSLPSLIALALFYSLAIHMRLSLGAWPQSIGERGFPPALVTHSHVTWRCWEVLAFVSIFGLPAVTVVCALVPRWRRFAVYPALGTLAFLLAWGLMFLAPARFLNWWWD